uniref:ATP synthase F0 subunit 6 n=1 Tax=Amoeboaphelidium protococcarum TaxID=1243177 RepID=UPI0022377039|nr:ATP synthase F0 subunit 6 [Amoeboaphelidium protococcarum]UYP50899.1 ATP synthase F0 subunit 6 [Amoeboaphelidium protococcarum]UYP50922.1 ATP synthase F0 subunit 6 [Amoeboaphelidium protococcarum]
MIFSPLEQFTIIPIIEISNFSIFAIFVLLTIILLKFLNKFILSKHIEWWYSNQNNIGDHIYILLTLWFLILISNLIGMVPYSLTLTAQGIFVFSIALPTFLAINLFGIKLHGHNLFYLFLPAGAPLILTPVIAILEFISYSIRSLSLTLRLSANMIAGHILMKIMIYAFIEMPLLSIIILPIVFLELMVAFLQAYVFLVLIISYYGDVSLPH